MEKIAAPIVYYDKKKDGIVIEYEPSDFAEDAEGYSLF